MLNFGLDRGSLIGTFAVAAACVYLAVTILFQFAPLRNRHMLLDRLAIVPRWQFFMQGVGDFTYAVDIRSRCPSSGDNDWMPLPLWPRRRRWHALWYPEQFNAGIAWGAVDSLARWSSSYGLERIRQSRAYATVLDLALRVMPDAEVQFAVLRCEGGERRLLFVSDFHRR